VNIREEVARLVGTESAAHKRLIEYVVRQLHTGRDLADVLEDPYITNRASRLDVRALLEEPEVVEAAGPDAIAGLRADLDALLGPEA